MAAHGWYVWCVQRAAGEVVGVEWDHPVLVEIEKEHGRSAQHPLTPTHIWTTITAHHMPPYPKSTSHTIPAIHSRRSRPVNLTWRCGVLWCRPVSKLIVQKKQEIERYCPSGHYPTPVRAHPGPAHSDLHDMIASIPADPGRSY